MLRSMTGFGGALGGVDGVEYAVELRSVNSRYYKIATKLPESLAYAESEIDKQLRAVLSRGSVTLSVRMKVPDEQAAYSVNTAALAKYIEQLKPLEAGADPILRIDLGSLLQLPGVCEPPPLDELCRKTQAGLMKLIDRALAGLIEMRQQEGKAIEADLLANCRVIEENLKTVADSGPRVLQLYHERLSNRVNELTQLGNVKIDEESLAREVAIYAERCDVAEEVSRLGGHLEQFRQVVEGPETAGRKLDFIAQEMLREANTVASKANDSGIGRAVVEIKTAVDRIKEQVQNAE